jgi:hypothetical protein
LPEGDASASGREMEGEGQAVALPGSAATEAAGFPSAQEQQLAMQQGGEGAAVSMDVGAGGGQEQTDMQGVEEDEADQDNPFKGLKFVTSR